MIVPFSEPILIIIATLIVASEVLFLFVLWNFIKNIFLWFPTKTKLARFLKDERFTCKVGESVAAEDIKIWIPKQLAYQTMEKHDLQFMEESNNG